MKEEFVYPYFEVGDTVTRNGDDIHVLLSVNEISREFQSTISLGKFLCIKAGRGWRLDDDEDGNEQYGEPIYTVGEIESNILGRYTKVKIKIDEDNTI